MIAANAVYIDTVECTVPVHFELSQMVLFFS